ncbi:MAG TPA: hemerythrin domain-containing protein [Gemmataceae bacterium]|nr:hemerythrin domain-containing protein [Gemmataceae bacterium]
MNDQTVNTVFAHDHDRLDELLGTYNQLKRVDFAKAKQAFKEFKSGLQRHIIWEETILFPLFEEKTGMHDRGPTVVMRAEHREIGRRLEALHDKVRRQDVDSDQEEQNLMQALFAHNQKEENVLYPAIDRLSSAEERAAAFTRMDELPEEAYRTCCSEKHAVAQHG